MGPTWQDEEDPGHKSQDGALRLDMSNVADDEGREDEEQWDHREGCGCPHHLWSEEETQRWESLKIKSILKF